MNTFGARYLIILLILCAITADAENAQRNYPSIFQAWNGTENQKDMDELHRLAQHDLAFAHPYTLLKIAWNISEGQPYSGLATDLNPDQLDTARQRKQELLTLNPNLLLLVEIRYRDARYVSRYNETDVNNWWEVGYFPPDSPYWLKDSEGKPVIGWGEDTNGDEKIDENDAVLGYLIDFTNPDMQNLMVKQVVALDKSGLFDGIMLDWWNEDYATSPIAVDDWSATILTREAESAARLSILRKIRAAVSEDFLILVNANMRQIPKSASYVNGLFMECYKTEYNRGYTLEQMLRMEETLLWAERHLREPRINCLEGWRVVTDYMGDLGTRVKERNSEENQQWMRMITTLSLTHSDGYVLFGDDNAIPVSDHLHNWYDFWNADLGQPIQERAIAHQGIQGLFIREFAKGWAVYNRSSTPQIVTFDVPVISTNTNQRQTLHSISDFDGDIFLKTDIE